MTYQQAYQEAAACLREHDISDAENDAWILLEYVTGMSRTRFYVEGQNILPSREEKRFLELVQRRQERIPVQHLTGIQEFMGMEFLVNESVLIPRQDTEILVESVEKNLREQKKVKSKMRILDMCTGSGCIGISLKARNQEIDCVMADISKEALKIAHKNAQKLRVDVEIVESDMFEQIEGRFDLIVSNPPYIQTAVIEKLEEEVRVHDPFLALDGKEDGLYFYRILAKKSSNYLVDGGWLYMEIGHDQSKEVEELLEKAGFDQIRTQKDLAGLDRVVLAVYNKYSKTQEDTKNV